LEKITIINTGGTFNKDYQLDGTLKVRNDNKIIKKIVKKVFRENKKNIKIKGILYKDSLEITTDDREKLFNLINEDANSKIIIVHGTDTITETAEYLSSKKINKEIIITGSMVPFKINKIEAVGNLMAAYGALKTNDFKEIHICINGIVESFKKIVKDKDKNRFVEEK
jgi:L-asparaginase